MTKEKNIVVGLLWHSITSDNLGVGALTIGQMTLIQEAARRRGYSTSFVVIGTKGGTPYRLDNFNIEASSEYALRAFKAKDFSAIKLLRRCDIVFDIGEGDSFSDIYGNKRLSVQVSGKVLSRLFGIPLVLSPQTIGPFKTGFGRFLGSVGIRAAKRVYARDHLSKKLLEDMGFSHKSQEVIDVAFALPFAKQQLPEGRTKVGINVSGLLYNGGYSGKNQFGLTVDYQSLIKQCCEFFLSQPDTDVYLVPHVISDSLEVEDDLRASEKLVQQYPDLKIAPRFHSPVEAKSFISSLDFFTGARMHACIAAFSSGVAVVPMAYSRKFNGLFNSLDYSYVMDCLKLSTDDALTMLRESFAQRAALKQDVDAGNKKAQAKLEVYINEVAQLLPT